MRTPGLPLNCPKSSFLLLEGAGHTLQHLVLAFLSQLYYNPSLLFTTIFPPSMIDFISASCITVSALFCRLRNAGHSDGIFANFPATCLSPFGLLLQMDNSTVHIFPQFGSEKPGDPHVDLRITNHT